MKLIGIPAGEFMQGVSGDQDAEAIAKSERPAHRVKISKPFYIGVYEVTQKEYRAVMSKSPWTGRLYVQEGDAIAASYVTWEDANAFCKKLSQREGKSVSVADGSRMGVRVPGRHEDRVQLRRRGIEVERVWLVR